MDTPSRKNITAGCTRDTYMQGSWSEEWRDSVLTACLKWCADSVSAMQCSWTPVQPRSVLACTSPHHAFFLHLKCHEFHGTSWYVAL